MEYLLSTASKDMESAVGKPVQEHLDLTLIPRPLASMHTFLVEDILDKLVVLNLSNCGLEKVPACLRALPCLQELDLSRNQLTHSCSQFLVMYMPFLKIIDLSNNYLNDIKDIQFLGLLSDLEVLNLEGNPLPAAANRCEMIRSLLFQTVQSDAFTADMRHTYEVQRSTLKYSPFLSLGSYRSIVKDYPTAVFNAVKAFLAVKSGSYSALNNNRYLQEHISIDPRKLTDGSLFSKSGWTNEGFAISGPGCVFLSDLRLEAPLIYVGKRDEVLNTYNSCLGSTATYAKVLCRRLEDSDSAANTGINYNKLLTEQTRSQSDVQSLFFFGPLRFNYLSAYTEQRGSASKPKHRAVSSATSPQRRATSQPLIFSNMAPSHVESCAANYPGYLPSDLEEALNGKDKSSQFFIDLNQRPLNNLSAPFPRLRILNNLIITIDDYDRAKQLNKTVMYTSYLLSPHMQLKLADPFLSASNTSVNADKDKKRRPLSALAGTKAYSMPPSEIIQQKQLTERAKRNAIQREKKLCASLKHFMATGQTSFSEEDSYHELQKILNEYDSDSAAAGIDVFDDFSRRMKNADHKGLRSPVRRTSATRRGSSARASSAVTAHRDDDLKVIDENPIVSVSSASLTTVPVFKHSSSKATVSELGMARMSVTEPFLKYDQLESVPETALDQAMPSKSESGSQYLEGSAISFTSNAFKAVSTVRNRASSLSQNQLHQDFDELSLNDVKTNKRSVSIKEPNNNNTSALSVVGNATEGTQSYKDNIGITSADASNNGTENIYALSLASSGKLKATTVSNDIMKNLITSTPSVGVMHTREKHQFEKVQSKSSIHCDASAPTNEHEAEKQPNARNSGFTRLENITLESLMVMQENERLSEEYKKRKKEIATSGNILQTSKMKSSVVIVDDDALCVKAGTVAKTAEPLSMLIRNADTAEEFNRIMSVDGQFRASKISPEYNFVYSVKALKPKKNVKDSSEVADKAQVEEQQEVGTTIESSIAMGARKRDSEYENDPYMRMVKASIARNPLKLETNAISYQEMANPNFDEDIVGTNSNIAAQIMPTFIDVIREEHRLQKKAVDETFMDIAKNMDHKIRKSVTKPSSQVMVRNIPQARFSANSDIDSTAKINRHSVLLDVALQGEKLAGEKETMQDGFAGSIPQEVIADAQYLTNKISNGKSKRGFSATSPTRKSSVGPGTLMRPLSSKPASGTVPKAPRRSSDRVLSYTSNEIMLNVDTKLYRQQLSMEKSRYRSSSRNGATTSESDEQKKRKNAMKLLYQNNEKLLEQERQEKYQKHLANIALIKHTNTNSYMTDERNPGMALYKQEMKKVRALSEMNKRMSKTSTAAEEIRSFPCTEKLRYKDLSYSKIANGVRISTGEVVKPLDVPTVEETIDHAGKIKIAPMELVCLSTDVISNIESNLKDLANTGSQFLKDELAWEEMIQDPDYKFNRTTSRLAAYAAANNSKLSTTRFQNLQALTSSYAPNNEHGQHINGILQDMAFRADAGLPLDSYSPARKSPIYAKANEARGIAQQIIHKVNVKKSTPKLRNSTKSL